MREVQPTAAARPPGGFVPPLMASSTRVAVALCRVERLSVVTAPADVLACRDWMGPCRAVLLVDAEVTDAST